jgi:hypothetical protein
MVARVGRFGVDVGGFLARFTFVHELQQFVKRVKLSLQDPTD